MCIIGKTFCLGVYLFVVTLMVTNANFVECTLGSCSGIMGVGFSKHHFNGYLAVHCQGIVINNIAKFLKKIIFQ